MDQSVVAESALFVVYKAKICNKRQAETHTVLKPFHSAALWSRSRPRL